MSPLNADLSDLPKAEPAQVEGITPDPSPRFVNVLAELWALDNAAQGDRPNAVTGSRFRFSDAGKCARAISYKAAGIQRTNPMDLSGTWNTRLGTMIHDAWQQALAIVYPNARVEVKVTLPDLDGSGHGDATVTLEDDGRVVVIELKTIGGYGMKDSIGKIRRGQPASGPKFEHIVQGALAARAQDADELVIGYLAKESLSLNMAKGMPEAARFCAEWTFGRDEYEPIADAETARINGILALVDDGKLAARRVPGPEGTPRGAEIVDVAASRFEVHDAEGMILSTGALWGGSFCGYCGWFDLCKQTAPGRIPVESVVALRGSM